MNTGHVQDLIIKLFFFWAGGGGEKMVFQYVQGPERDFFDENA